MALQIIRPISGLILFLLPGILLSYIIFPKTGCIKRAISSITLAVCILAISGVFLYRLNLLTSLYTISCLVFLCLIFIAILIRKSKATQYKTYFDKDIFYVLLFTFIGTLWRLYFLKSIKNFSDPYGYAFKFVGRIVPDLGFYTNMAIDHSRFVGGYVFSKVTEFLSINKITDGLSGAFLITFLFLGFVYLVFFTFDKDRKMACLGLTLMALGPIEIFHATINLFGHPFSYIALFSLFLLYKSEDRGDFYVALLLSTAMIFTYFTSAMINTLTSIGFIISIFAKNFYGNKNNILDIFKNRKMLAYALIAIVSFTFIFGFSSSKGYSSSNMELITKHITTYPILKYQDPTFLGLSAIRWQMAFFFLCGISFIWHLVRKRDFSGNNIELLSCLIPISIVSYGFLHVNMPTRIFNYFAFFGLLVLQIPRKYFRLFFILSFVFILVSSFYVVKDKKIFFETSDEEIEGALWISENLDGRVFADNPFVNQLVLNGYYKVTGANDDDRIVYELFCQDSPPILLDALDYLKDNLDAEYIAITKRMQKQYILMLNMPQKPLINAELYEENLVKVYNNGDVRIYQIDIKKSKEK